jgi:xanthine/CO dehydrogenase XdhC/CoxF family maturation factor
LSGSSKRFTTDSTDDTGKSETRISKSEAIPTFKCSKHLIPRVLKFYALINRVRDLLKARNESVLAPTPVYMLLPDWTEAKGHFKIALSCISEEPAIMSERDELLRAMEAAMATGKKAVLASVVRVTGSAYRREGTRMLIDEDGAMTCMISGGCLEPTIAEIAQTVLRTGEPVVRHFDLEEDVVWGLGIGCGGSIDVFIEPLEMVSPLDSWMRELSAGRAVALATVIEVSGTDMITPGARMLVREDGWIAGTLGPAELDKAVRRVIDEKFHELLPRAETRLFSLPTGEKAEVFIDVSTPPPELVVFGAGHDAIPLVALGVRQGYRVVVVDARSAFLTADRFPGARLIVAHPPEFKDRVVLGPRSYVVIMNHHLERDRACLRFAFDSAAPYIGVLGPRSRYIKLIEGLRQEGVAITEAAEARVYNPVGLDIGADSPEEVALSILGEILAVRTRHAGGFLRQRGGRIHEPANAAVESAVG